MKKTFVKKLVCVFMAAALVFSVTPLLAQVEPCCEPGCCYCIPEPGGPGDPEPWR